MKRNRFTILTTIILLLNIGIWVPKTFAQVINSVDNAPVGKFYLEMMQDPNVNFYEAQSAFNNYWANRTDFKGNGYKVFKRWEYINETRVLPDGKLPAPEQAMNEYTRYMSKLDGPASASGNWSIWDQRNILSTIPGNQRNGANKCHRISPN
ncbi:MAG: hypothetical protein IPH45_03485 [Bacteroidales bacterium]|nr:hypothetical protein [Bacteroidales bacterium]